MFEIAAEAVGPSVSRARCGVKAHSDPGLVTDMAEVTVALDASQPHTWTVVWGEGVTTIGCEGRVPRRVEQAPDYPLFLLVDLFEIGGPGGSYPKTAGVRRVRGWSE